jgi:excinuclease ABC subunit B
MGRAARNINGRVILYADVITGSIKRAVDETNRRRNKQLEYNAANNITPKSITKHIYDSIRIVKETASDDYDVHDDTLTTEEIQNLITQLRKDMKSSAIRLEFEKAAELRDKIEFLAKKIK